jgi:hypothetical protein
MRIVDRSRSPGLEKRNGGDCKKVGQATLGVLIANRNDHSTCLFLNQPSEPDEEHGDPEYCGVNPCHQRRARRSSGRGHAAHAFSRVHIAEPLQDQTRYQEQLPRRSIGTRGMLSCAISRLPSILSNRIGILAVRCPTKPML